jgi:CRP-like cAMP-binding protein
MNDIIKLISTIHPISPALQDQLTLSLKEKTFLKKEYLLKEGQVCRNICFIKSGLFRCFYNRDLTEVCSWFMQEGDIIISVDSFFQQKPSFESIQALEDSLVYSMTYDQLQTIYRTFPEFNFIGRVLTEKYYALSEERLYSIRMQRSPERYQYLMLKFPHIIQRVPSKYIASYIGVTEETLSRIRSKKY